MTATPKATAVVCTMSPVHRPRVTSKPANLPCRADWVRTKILSGPGARASRTEAAKKAAAEKAAKEEAEKKDAEEAKTEEANTFKTL